MLRTAAFLIFMLVSGLVSAEPIIARAGVLSRLVFTDNLFLSRQGKESDVILQLLPNISGGRSANHANYRYYYGPSFIFYGGDNSDLNRVFQVLQADGIVDVIDNYLAIRANARANQNIIDPGVGSAGFDALGNPNAFAQTASVSVTPVIRLPIVKGDFATVQIEPGINYVFSTDTADGQNNVGNAGSLSRVQVRSGDYFPRAPWSLVWQSNVFNDNDRYDNYQSAYGTVSYIITPQWRIQGLAGYDGQSSGIGDADQGPRWRITPFWTPSPNTSIGIGFGERYSGQDWYLTLRHQLKKATISFNYETTLTNARTEILTDDVVEFEDPFGDQIIDPLDNQSLSGTVNNPALVSGTYVLKQLTGTIAYRMGRNNVNFRVWRNSREFEVGDYDYTDNYSTLTLTRAMNSRLNGRLGLIYWSHSQSNDQATDFNQYRATVRLTYRLNRRTRTSIQYAYLNRTSDVERQDYDENRVTLTLNWAM